MPTHPNTPLHHRPAPRDRLPAQPGPRKKSSGNRLYEKILENVLKTAIATIVMILVFRGIVRLMDSKKIPYLKISQDVMQGDGQFTISTEYGFVREAYLPDGKKMSQDELKRLAEQPKPEFNFELVDPAYPSQW